jgi:hypothetical protein
LPAPLEPLEPVPVLVLLQAELAASATTAKASDIFLRESKRSMACSSVGTRAIIEARGGEGQRFVRAIFE